MVNSSPQVVFDLGGQFREAAGKDTVFVSHSHMDHIAAIPWHTSYRSMVKQHPATYLVPEAAEAGMLDVLAGHANLSEKSDAMQCNLVPVSPNHLVMLRKKSLKVQTPAFAAGASADSSSGEQALAPHRFQGHPARALVLPSTADVQQYSTAEFPHYVRIFATEHRVPSHAHVLYARRKSYPTHLLGAGEDIGAAIKEGRLLPEMTTTAELGVSGDTLLDSVLDCPDLCSASVLVLECTYLEDTPKTSIAKCRERGHVHLHEFALAWAAGVFTNNFIVLAHISARYSFHDAHRLVQRALSAAVKQMKQDGTLDKFDAQARPEVHVHCPGAPRSQVASGSRVKVGGNGGGGAAAGGEGSHDGGGGSTGSHGSNSRRDGRGRGGYARGGRSRGGARGGASRGGGRAAGGGQPQAQGFQRWGTKRAPGTHAAASQTGAHDSTKRARGPSEGQPQG